MAARTPDADLGTFRERDTPTLRATVLDNSVPAVAIPGSALATMALTLYDEKTGAIVNDRDAVDIKANVDEAGLLEFELEQDDMAMVNAASRAEYRRILLEWTWDVTKRGSSELRMRIVNVANVP